MEADDISPTRIAAAKQTASTFIDNAPIDINIGIVSFSGSSRIEQDLTNEKDMLKRAVNGIELKEIGGTDIYEAILTSSNLLKNQDHRAVILLSDGQINVGTIDDAIDYANYYQIIVHTIGIGTKEGGIAEYGLSKLDEDSLKSLAYEAGGIYASAENQENLTKAFSDIFQLTERKVAINISTYLLLFAILLVLLEFFLSNTKYLNLP